MATPTAVGAGVACGSGTVLVAGAAVAATVGATDIGGAGVGAREGPVTRGVALWSRAVASAPFSYSLGAAVGTAATPPLLSTGTCGASAMGAEAEPIDAIEPRARKPASPIAAIDVPTR